MGKNTSFERCAVEAMHYSRVDVAKKTLLEDKDFILISNLHKTIGDPTRVKIIWALAAEELCVCDIAYLLRMTHSAISHQLRVLKQAELVTYRREGKIIYYSLANDKVIHLLEQSKMITNKS